MNWDCDFNTIFGPWLLWVDPNAYVTKKKNIRNLYSGLNRIIGSIWVLLSSSANVPVVLFIAATNNALLRRDGRETRGGAESEFRGRNYSHQSARVTSSSACVIFWLFCGAKTKLVDTGMLSVLCSLHDQPQSWPACTPDHKKRKHSCYCCTTPLRDKIRSLRTFPGI